VKNILDAGPLIAALNREDQHHRWACDTLERLGPPFYTCPEALAEAAALTGQPAAIVEMVQQGELVLAFSLADQAAGVLALLRKYADRRMDLADACIVRMTELMRDSRVVTVDRADFAVYRRHGRDLIPVIVPPPAE
jgi:predicted nucleic acid-binding protein